MSWFIRKGDPVEERKPTEIEFNQKFLVSSGHPRSLKLEVFCDENNDSAPVHKTSSGRDLVTLEANLTHISRSDMDPTIKVGEDGHGCDLLLGVDEVYVDLPGKAV
jgi:hypothetical protein